MRSVSRWAATTRAGCRSIEYLHRPRHPRYAIADNFFQAAFGGSFLNHQWLIAAATPTWPGAPNNGGADDLHSVVDANGMPTSYPLYTAGPGVKDAALTASCQPPAGAAATPAGVTCGDFAVNTIQPFYQPYAPGTAVTRRLPPQTHATIGDRLSQAHVELGLVLRRLVQRERRRRRAGLDERHRPRPRDGDEPGAVPGRRRDLGRDVAELPRQAVPVPPPAVQLLRRLRARQAGTRPSPARRAGVPRPG